MPQQLWFVWDWFPFSCWLLVVGCWLLVIGCWLLVVGYWLLVVCLPTPYSLLPTPHSPSSAEITLGGYRKNHARGCRDDGAHRGID
nr:hypothetical protein [Limnofasciculus baicalensis]